MPAGVTYLNPPTMHHNPAFSQGVAVDGAARTVYIGGQNAVDGAGEIVGKGDLGAQMEQIFDNLETVLAAAGGRLQDIVKWTIYAVAGQDVRPALPVFARRWGGETPPPAISVLLVQGLANPDFLAEVEAIAIVREEGADR